MQVRSSTKLCSSCAPTRSWRSLKKCVSRYWKSGRAVPEDWRVWVRGVAGADIAALVEKVVFQLHPDTQFPFPKKIRLEAPYQLEEAGSALSDIDITIHLKSTKPEKLLVKYGSLFLNAEECRADSRCVYYDVQHPAEQLRASLEQAAPPAGGGARAVLPARPRPRTPPANIDEPSEPKLSHTQMMLFESCAMCDGRKYGGAACPLLLAENALIERKEKPVPLPPEKKLTKNDLSNNNFEDK